MGPTEVGLIRQGTSGACSLLTPPKRCDSRAVAPKAASHRRATFGAAHRSDRSPPPTEAVGSTWCAGARRAVSGYGRLLPWGSVPFGVSSPGDRSIVRSLERSIASVCLADAIRSQGFSPSQRFEPAWTVWLFFTPHPPLGFRNGLQSVPRAASRGVSQHPLLSCRWSWFPPPSSEPGVGFRPCLWLHLTTLLSPPASQPTHRSTRTAGSDISSNPVLPQWSEIGERASGPNRWLGLSTRCAQLGADGPRKATRSSVRQARARDFRALLRPSVRFRAAVFWNATRTVALLTFSPSEAHTPDRWACALPSCACSASSFALQRKRNPRLRRTSGYRSGRAWRPLRRPASTSLGSSTSSDPRQPSGERGQARSHHLEEPRPKTSPYPGSSGVTRCEVPSPTEVRFGKVTSGD
jgi:hypothetical protein